MSRKVDHIGIAVKDLEKSIVLWAEVFNLKEPEIEEIIERKVRIAKFPLTGGSSLELISPLGEDSPVAKFLNSKGEGIHHFCFEVEDIEKEVEKLKKKGIEFVQDSSHKGTEGNSIAFIHPKNLNGVLIELKERARR